MKKTPLIAGSAVLAAALLGGGIWIGTAASADKVTPDVVQTEVAKQLQAAGVTPSATPTAPAVQPGAEIDTAHAQKACKDFVTSKGAAYSSDDGTWSDSAWAETRDGDWKVESWVATVAVKPTGGLNHLHFTCHVAGTNDAPSIGTVIGG